MRYRIYCFEKTLFELASRDGRLTNGVLCLYEKVAKGYGILIVCCRRLSYTSACLLSAHAEIRFPFSDWDNKTFKINLIK